MPIRSVKTICPLIKNPYKDCYCAGMNSQKVLYALEYCGGTFERCEIYIRHMLEEKLKEVQNRNSGNEAVGRVKNA
jgi:hypothetical protein